MPSRSQRDRSWLRRVLKGAALGLATLLCGVVVVGFVAQAASGCGAPDPTDPINATSVVIVNDTPSAVRIDDCAGTWCQQDHTVAAPGARITARAACGMSGSSMTSYRVTNSAGHAGGFIAVHAPRSDDHFTFLVSRASTSRHIAPPHQ